MAYCICQICKEFSAPVPYGICDACARPVESNVIPAEVIDTVGDERVDVIHSEPDPFGDYTLTLLYKDRGWRRKMALKEFTRKLEAGDFEIVQHDLTS